MIKSLAMRVLATVLLLVISQFVYASYYVWGTVRFWDSRTERAAGHGSLLPPIPGGALGMNAPLQHATLRLFDRDGDCIDAFASCPESDDDYLGITTTDANGFYELSGPNNFPDIYLTFNFCGPQGCVRRMNRAFVQSISAVREPNVTFANKDFNVTCWDDELNDAQGLCNNHDQVQDTQAFNFMEPYAAIFQSMSDVRNRIGSMRVNGHNQPITIYHDVVFGGECRAIAGAAYSDGFDRICIRGEGAPLRNQLVAHELGHIWARRLLDERRANSDGSCTGTRGGGAYESVGSGEKCTVWEGWGRFFAVATYFDDDAADPWYRSINRPLEGNTATGNNGVEYGCTFRLANPETSPGNVIRFFWDLYDRTHEGSGETTYDNVNLPLLTISGVFDQFERGRRNRQADETGPNGRNVYDFVNNNTRVDFNDVLIHNCLDGQIR